MDIQSLIQEADSAGVSLFIEDGKLGYKTNRRLKDRSILSRISGRKSHIIAYLEGQQAARLSGDAPASLSQKRIWLTQQLQPGTTDFNIPMWIRFDNSWDTHELETTIRNLISSHEIFNTCYYEKDDEVYQRVQSDLVLTVEHHQCTQSSEQDLAEQVQTFSAYSFELEADMPVRVAFFHTATGCDLCLLFHHIALDETACQTFVAQLFASHQQHTTPSRTEQYRDYALWQKQHLTSPAFQRHATAFIETLRGAPQLHRLPLKAPHAQNTRSTAQTIPVTIPDALADSVKHLCQEARITEFSFYHTVLAILLGHWSKVDDVMFGTPVIHRPTANMDQVLGCFLNLLPLRHQLDYNWSFAELIEYIKGKQNALMRYQDVPFEYVLEQLKPARQPYVNPLFQILVSNHTSTDQANSDSQSWSFVSSAQATSKYDLTLKIVTAPNEARILWQYREDLFSSELMTMMSDSLVPLLTQLMNTREQTLKHALTEIKYPTLAQLTSTQNAPKRTLLGALAEHAQHQPHAIALRCHQQQISYESLNNQINLLAQNLLNQGLKQGDHLGLMLERHCDMVIAMLAALRLGLIYIPMDPDYPQQRLEYIALKGQCKLILCEHTQQLSGTFAQMTLDELRAQPVAPTDLDLLPESDQLAYIIFTSGSTGQPKGVKINHGNLDNFLTSMVTQLSLTRHDTLLAVTPISFDISVLELFAPLMAGGEVVIAPQQQRDGLSLKQQLNTLPITVMQATPAGWQSLLDAGWEGKPTVRALSGGERLPTTLAQALNGKVACLWNMYGPTEATVWATCQLVDPNTSQDIPLGQPINDCAIHILDEQGNPCPPQMRGEIVIAGACVGQGYVGLASQTAERFITLDSPQGPVNAYRTGDLGYINCEGELYCLGRNDHQVKIRGFRIELQEIERQLQQLAALEKVCVVVHTMPNGSQKLIAYFADPTQTQDCEQLQFQLRQVLPAYMVPDFIIAMDKLPLTPSGKIDRNHLASLEPSPEYNQLVPPANDQEQQLLELWKSLLNLSDIGTNCNFFALGGDSITAIKLVSQLQTLGLNANSGHIFQHQTIKDLAQSLIPNSTPNTVLASEQQLHGVEVIGDAVSEADLQSLFDEFES